MRGEEHRDQRNDSGLEAALEISGLNSSKYIWRYVRASAGEVEQAVTDFWE